LKLFSWSKDEELEVVLVLFVIVAAETGEVNGMLYAPITRLLELQVDVSFKRYPGGHFRYIDEQKSFFRDARHLLGSIS
jgi:hypothetical protein